MLLAVSLMIALPAFAQDRASQTDPATMDAIRAAAKQFANAAESVRVALETKAPAQTRTPSAPKK